jgi:hypothetical protein
MFMAATSIGTLPAACAASVWNSTPRSRVIAPISASGCTTPISLLAAMTDTSTVRSVIASRSSSSRMKPVAVHAQPGDPPPLALEPLERVEHRLVLRDGGHEVIAPFAQGVRRPLDRQVVRLRRAAREADLAGVAPMSAATCCVRDRPPPARPSRTCAGGWRGCRTAR